MSGSHYEGRHVSLSLSDPPSKSESERSFERYCQECTRKLLAQPLDAAEALDLVREMLRSSEGDFCIQRAADLHGRMVDLRNTVRRQANELGEMRAREKERGSELERRQASEIMRLQQALELARGEAHIANGAAERSRAEVVRLRALFDQLQAQTQNEKQTQPKRQSKTGASR